TVEIPSPVAGTVVALGGEVGSVLAVGAELVRLEVAGAGDDEVVATPKQVAAPKPAPQKPAPQKPGPVEAQREEAQAARSEGARSEAPPLSLPPRPAIARPIASPAVRRRAREAGVDLRQVQGSGPAGRIVHQDLDAFLRGAGGAAGGARRGADRIAN